MKHKSNKTQKQCHDNALLKVGLWMTVVAWRSDRPTQGTRCAPPLFVHSALRSWRGWAPRQHREEGSSTDPLGCWKRRWCDLGRCLPRGGGKDDPIGGDTDNGLVTGCKSRAVCRLRLYSSISSMSRMTHCIEARFAASASSAAEFRNAAVSFWVAPAPCLLGWYS